MPIISRVGRRSLKLRLVITALYAVLILGAVSMVYPLLLMLSMSVASEPDYRSFTLLPRYFFNDDALWPKFVESKYTEAGRAQEAWFRKKTTRFCGLGRRTLEATLPSYQAANPLVVYIICFYLV